LNLSDARPLTPQLAICLIRWPLGDRQLSHFASYRAIVTQIRACAPENRRLGSTHCSAQHDVLALIRRTDWQERGSDFSSLDHDRIGPRPQRPLF